MKIQSLAGFLFLLLFTQCTDNTLSPEAERTDTTHTNTNKPAYTLSVNGEEIPVDTCRVSAAPVNMYWAGKQRPLEQTEEAYFASWDMPQNNTPARIKIVSGQAISSVKINPASLNIQPIVDGNTISFTMPKTGSVTVEVNGTHHALHLFASPQEKDIPIVGTAGLRYYGPGVHHVGHVQLASNESVYVARGAVVYGRFSGYENQSNIRIYGRGIIDGSLLEQNAGHILGFTSCNDVTIEGVTLRDPGSWCSAFFGCKRLNISNVNLIGLWRYNSDGIDVCNCQDVKVRNCFVRSFDDAIVIKGLEATPGQPSVLNNEISGCVLWCDWGNAIKIGIETYAPRISNVVFKDCDVIRTTHCAMGIVSGDHAKIDNILFENIRVSVDNDHPLPTIQANYGDAYKIENTNLFPELLGLWIESGKSKYSTSDIVGTINNIVFKNISVTTNRVPISYFVGADRTHPVNNIKIQNLRINNQHILNVKESGVDLGPFVYGVQFE